MNGLSILQFKPKQIDGNSSELSVLTFQTTNLLNSIVLLWLWQWFIIGFIRLKYHRSIDWHQTLFRKSTTPTLNVVSLVQLDWHNYLVRNIFDGFSNQIKPHYKGICVVPINFIAISYVCNFNRSAMYLPQNRGEMWITITLRKLTTTINGRTSDKKKPSDKGLDGLTSIIDRLSSWILCQALSHYIVFWRVIRSLFGFLENCVCIVCAKIWCVWWGRWWWWWWWWRWWWCLYVNCKYIAKKAKERDRVERGQKIESIKQK